MTNEEILQMVNEKGSLIVLQEKLPQPHNERRLPPKNYNRRKNGRKQEKRKTGNDVTEKDDERVQQDERETRISC